MAEDSRPKASAPSAWRKIRAVFRRKEETPISDRFIEGIEIIYSLILACAVVKMVDVLQDDGLAALRALWHALLVSCLFLLRFFFAPSQNLKILGRHARGWKWTIIPFDGLVLLGFSFWFYYMCQNIRDNDVFYRSFFLLLFVDAVWLLTIILRCRKTGFLHNKIWLYNNLAFVAAFLLLPPDWRIWFGLAVANSLIDLGSTYSEYFSL